MSKPLNPLLIKFRDEICGERGKELDREHDELDWFSLSVGFFLANGASIGEALGLAITARYNYQYWYD
jgi:hypothetical protein